MCLKKMVGGKEYLTKAVPDGSGVQPEYRLDGLLLLLAAGLNGMGIRHGYPQNRSVTRHTIMATGFLFETDGTGHHLSYEQPLDYHFST